MFFMAYDLCGSSLVKIKAEGQTIAILANPGLA